MLGVSCLIVFYGGARIIGQLIQSELRFVSVESNQAEQVPAQPREAGFFQQVGTWTATSTSGLAFQSYEQNLCKLVHK